MISCVVSGIDVHPSSVFVASMGFNTPRSHPGMLDYIAKIEIQYIIEKFGKYYCEFIDRNRYDDYSEISASNFRELHQAGYPNLVDLFEKWPDLFLKMVVDEFPSELLGFCFEADDKFLLTKRFVLQSLVSASIFGRSLVCKGLATRTPFFD